MYDALKGGYDQFLFLLKGNNVKKQEHFFPKAALALIS